MCVERPRVVDPGLESVIPLGCFLTVISGRWVLSVGWSLGKGGR